MMGAPVASMRDLMKTPPMKTRRQSTKEQAPASPMCASGFCGIFQLIQRAVGGPHREPTFAAKLDRLAEKVDVIASKISISDIEPLGEQAALRVLEEADRDGIEVARYSQLPQFDASILDT
eukprot:CAMPEP_0179042778 /NCGR_PEP_ID=MMETSP0796-20121207/16833_1 /TAXON_ID=73915 /ORGANISM="Pyrodinium bahamense, Strain pbaha01" /LENGTH=120 /DNA_ID=CAMNT_0020739155 /DNA_START=79 /DNA_END=438 /DNA_ORIENTATION=+